MRRARGGGASGRKVASGVCVGLTGVLRADLVRRIWPVEQFENGHLVSKGIRELVRSHCRADVTFGGELSLAGDFDRLLFEELRGVALARLWFKHVDGWAVDWEACNRRFGMLWESLVRVSGRVDLGYASSLRVVSLLDRGSWGVETTLYEISTLDGFLGAAVNLERFELGGVRLGSECAIVSDSVRYLRVAVPYVCGIACPSLFRLELFSPQTLSTVGEFGRFQLGDVREIFFCVGFCGSGFISLLCESLRSITYVVSGSEREHLYFPAWLGNVGVVRFAQRDSCRGDPFFDDGWPVGFVGGVGGDAQFRLADILKEYSGEATVDEFSAVRELWFGGLPVMVSSHFAILGRFPNLRVLNLSGCDLGSGPGGSSTYWGPVMVGVFTARRFSSLEVLDLSHSIRNGCDVDSVMDVLEHWVGGGVLKLGRVDETLVVGRFRQGSVDRFCSRSSVKFGDVCFSFCLVRGQSAVVSTFEFRVK